MQAKTSLFSSAVIILCACLLLLCLSQYTAVLSVSLAVLGYIKHRLIPIKKEVWWFLIVCIAGAVIEILLVNVGGAWQYSDKHILNIPIWMPLFWGVIGTTIPVIYDEFAGK